MKKLVGSCYKMLQDGHMRVPIENMLMFAYAVEGLPSQDSTNSELWNRCFKELGDVQKI